MQSQGSTSSQPSFDSFSSSDTEHAEDDADVFLADGSPSVVGGGGTAGALPDGGRAAAAAGGSPGSRWTCHNFTGKDEEEEEEEAKTSPAEESEPRGRTPKTRGDVMFARKCAELRGFVRPLLELLNGLKKGRFDRGLSSFQQSVAMDRIQRIVGVLQRPNCGEKYLNTLLQVEVMLKLWFPHIAASPPSAASSAATSPALSPQDTAGFTASHRHKDQSHIPVKKRRLSWTGTDSPAPSPMLPKSPRVAPEAEKSLSTQSEQGKPSKCKGPGSEPSLTWVHAAPIPSPRTSGSPAAAEDGDRSAGRTASSRRRSSPATQDSSVSSSTTARKNQRNANRPARCQGRPGDAQASDSDTGPSRSKQSPRGKTLHREPPVPLET